MMGSMIRLDFFSYILNNLNLGSNRLNKMSDAMGKLIR